MIKMFSDKSPLMSIPDNLDKKLIFSLDGIRVCLQNIELSLFRVLKLLSNFSDSNSKDKSDDFACVKLDAWGFVDNVYRFIGLWELLNKLIEINRKASEQEFHKIKEIRNVQSHLAQRVDFIVSKNASVSGEISWIKLESLDPLVVKTYFIRSGVFVSHLNFQLLLPEENISFNEFGIGSIVFNVSDHSVNLLRVYDLIFDLKVNLESKLLEIFNNQQNCNSCPINLFGSAILDTSSWKINS